MTSAGYQRALCDCVASPTLCLAVRRAPAAALAPYPLTPRERRRIEAAVHQPGMSVSCSLYRMNRITPLATLLPLTCRLLGPHLVPLAERFWRECSTNLQFRTETQAFRDFLHRQPAIAELGGPYLDEVLEFEIAANQLRFQPRDEPGDMPGRPPRVAVVVFRHDPAVLLAVLAAEHEPPPLAAGEFAVVLNYHGGELRLSMSQVDTGTGGCWEG